MEHISIEGDCLLGKSLHACKTRFVSNRSCAFTISCLISTLQSSAVHVLPTALVCMVSQALTELRVPEELDDMDLNALERVLQTLSSYYTMKEGALSAAKEKQLLSGLASVKWKGVTFAKDIPVNGRVLDGSLESCCYLSAFRWTRVQSAWHPGSRTIQL